ncbi:MAG: penicillin-binding protein 1A [Bacteroidia bacterium]
MASVKKAPYTKYIVLFWSLFVLLLGGVTAFFTAISQGYFGELPAFEELENPKSSLATEVISADGIILGKYYVQNRSYTKYEELSPYLIDALIATEDVRFKKHTGIDPRGLTRAVVYLGKKGGASTITQQLALNLFSGQRASSKTERIMQKFKEWVISIQLESRYTKPEILAMYLNTVDFGYNSFGIKSASRTYFNKDVKNLNVQEAAMLVGILKGITLYSPVRNPQNALNRRNTVIGQMVKYDYLEKEAGDSIKALPIELDLRPQSHSSGLATYFREYLRMELNKWIEANRKADGSKYSLYRDGLRVYTTLDSRMQEHAEASVKAHMKDLQKTFFEHWKGREPWGRHTEILISGMKRSDRYRALRSEGYSEAEIREIFDIPIDTRLFSWDGWIDTLISPMDSIRYAKQFLHTGFMAMEPGSGHIKAWVGGIDIDFAQYDHVNPTAKRQAGSTFKPLVYTLAIDNGFDPCLKIPNQPVTFEKFQNWTPKNYDGKNGGYLDMFEGLAASINNIVAYLMKQVGPESVIDLSRNMGITSPMEPFPSLCLGSFDMSVYEMVGAYATYANKGVWTQPIFITRIEDNNGNVLAEFFPATQEALSEETAYAMVKLLQGVVDKGTARRLRFRYNLKNEIGGKTGTTQNNSDGWFIGITPELAAGAWVGADDRAVRFRTTALGGGANSALPIWGEFYRRIYADERLGLQPQPFEAPSSMTIQLNCNARKEPPAATPGTQNQLQDIF